MKKLIFYVFSVIFIVCFLSFSTSATETDEEYYSEMLSSIVDSDTSEKLEEIGLQDFSPDEIFSVSFNKIGEYFSASLRSKTVGIISDFFRIFSILIIFISIKNFFCADNGMSLTIMGVISVALLSVDISTDIIEVLISTMKTSGSFMLSFIPIYTVLLSIGGNVSSAVSYNTITFSFAQIISMLINSYATDFTGIFISLSLAFSLNSTLNLNRFISSVNKLVSTVIGFLASGFAAMLSVRGVLSATIDSAASKSIKYLIGSLIPVVGSSISDAYSTVLGSINVIKSSIAVAGIIIMLVICVPPILEGVTYCITFSLLSWISEMAELGEITSVLKAIQSVIRTMILLNILQMFILLVSTGILIAVKGGA